MMAGFDALELRTLNKASEKAAHDGMRKIGGELQRVLDSVFRRIEASRSTRFTPLSGSARAEPTSDPAGSSSGPGRKPSAKERTSRWMASRPATGPPGFSGEGGLAQGDDTPVSPV